MKKSILILAAAAAFVFGMTSCTDEPIVNNGDNPIVNSPRVKTTADLDNTDWACTVTYYEFLNNMLGIDTTCMSGFEDDTMVFGLNFDGTYAHFSFPENVMAFGGDEGELAQIQGVSYTYSYNGTTHTGYLDGVAEDVNGNDVPAQLEFTYDDATDVITFNLPMFYAEDSTAVTLTLNFARSI